MELYLDKTPETLSAFKKEAAFAARLSDTPENWPQEVNSELFKQLPFLSDYDVSVNLESVDPQRGYGYGFADITNKTERPEIEHQDVGIPHVRIPIIIQDRALKPFSTFLDGERTMPLNENRLREILFNPQTFDLSTAQPKDPSLVDSLTPPQRTGSAGETKTASVKHANGDMLQYFADNPKKLKEKLKRDEAKKSKTGSAELDFFNALQKEAVSPEWINKRMWSGAQAVAQKSGLAAAGQKVQKVMNRGAGVGDRAAKAAKNSQLSMAAQHHAGNATGAEQARQTANNQLRRRATGDQSIISGAKIQSQINKAQGIPKQKAASILKVIAPTLREKDVELFVEKIASDATLQAGFRRSGIAPLLVDVFENTKRASAEDRLLALSQEILPSVITFQKLPGGDFLVKSANVNAFVHDKLAAGEVVPAAEAAEAIGPDNAQAMRPGQTASVVSEPVEPQPIIETNEKIVDEFGEWLVQDAMGNRLMGWVFPKTMAWDGNFTPQPMALFTNGSAYAVQDSVAGELVGKGATLPSDTPRGDGVFYCVENGRGQCTQPITINGSAAGPSGEQKFIGVDIFGNQIQVSRLEGLKMPMRVSDVEYAFPASWKFMRLNNQTQLVQDPVQMNKAASARSEKNSVELFYNGAYNFRGGCGLNKLASEFRQELDPVGAEFMLGLLGVDCRSAKQKIKEAHKNGSVKMAGLKSITLLGERFREAEKVAHTILQNIPDLRRDLVKEAAALADTGEATVDKILSLNFINPENLVTFIQRIPELEECAEHLAEMLLMSYLGMTELPESPIERAMRNMEEVITALKALSDPGA